MWEAEGLTGALDAELWVSRLLREDVFDDGFTMFLEAQHTTGETHTVGVNIDNNLGVMAKDILLADSIEPVAEVMRQNPGNHGELRLEHVDPAAPRLRSTLHWI